MQEFEITIDAQNHRGRKTAVFCLNKFICFQYFSPQTKTVFYRFDFIYQIPGKIYYRLFRLIFRTSVLRQKNCK